MISLLRRRSIGSVAAVALAVTVTVAAAGLAPDAHAAPGVDLGRLAGGDRYQTAAAIATDTFGSADIALLVSGENFPDALASSYLAAVSDAPILLSLPDRVPDVTIAALQQLGTDLVVLVGGPAALSAAVPAQLTAAGFPNARVAGNTRYQTAIAAASVTGPVTVGVNEAGVRTALLASGEGFADALAAGPLASDDRFPLLLTPPSGLDPLVEQALQTLDVHHVIIVGGSGAVAPAVDARLTALGITSERLQGGDRYATARAVAEKAVAALGHSAAHVDIATGERFPDALAAGPHAGRAHGAILLTAGAAAGTEACTFLAARSATITSGHLLGGEQVIPAAAEAGLEACAAGAGPGPGPDDDPNIDFPASPTGDALTTLGADGASLTWTFTGVDAVADVALVPCFAVTDGPVTIADDPVELDDVFPPAEQDGRVGRAPDHLGASYRSARLGGAGAAQIVAVNGAVAPSQYVDGVAVPAGGQLEVTVSATAADCARVVVFADPSDVDQLVLGADGRPTGDFGIGGAGVFTLGEAPEDTTIAGDVLYLDKAADVVVLDSGYRFDYGGTGDVYVYDQFQVQPGDFEIALSRLDRLGAVAVPSPYHRSAPNRFNISSDVPGVVTGVTASFSDADGEAADTSANDATVTFAAPAPVDGLVVDYVVDVYRCAPACLPVRQVRDSDHEPASAVPPANPDVNNDGLDDDVDRRVVVEDLQAGSYRFVVSAVSYTGSRSIFGSRSSALVTAAAATGSPRSTLADVITATADGVLGPGDVLRVTFDKVMAAPNVGDSVTLRDAADRTATLTHGANATFAVTGTVVTITVDAAVAGGAISTGQPLQATGSSGVTDQTGKEWDLPGSGDRTFD